MGVVIEDRGDGYPFIGRTGKGDMRSTREVGQIILGGGVRHAFVDVETYKLLLDATTELACLLPQLRGLTDELDGAMDGQRAGTDTPRWLGYVQNRLKTIIDAQSTKDA